MSPSPSEFVRMSESPLWDLQRAFFEAAGPRAWSTGTVPHYVTCNPFMARAFADVILGFLGDRPAGGGRMRTLYVVELGAGSGRLAWNIVRALQGAVDAASRGWRMVYVMTDLAERTVAWWQQHPRLQPLVEAGLVDFARFDATADRALELRVSGRTIDADDPVDELVVIANYVFDSLPHDVFRARGGRLEECLVAGPDLRLEAGGLAGTELTWRARPARRDYYADPVLDRILDEHAGVDGVFTFPRAAFDALARVRALTRGPLLVLSADKGGARLEDVVTEGAPAVATHGSVSMLVNYHAIGRWVLAHGGTWMHGEHHHRSLEVCGFALGLGRGPSTLAAFDRAISQRGPDDFYALKRTLVRHAGELSLEELLAYLRLSGHDAKLLLDCAAAWRAAVAGASTAARADLALALHRVWDGYFPIGEGDALPLLIAELVAQLDDDTPAPAAEDPFDVITGQDAGRRAA